MDEKTEVEVKVKMTVAPNSFYLRMSGGTGETEQGEKFKFSSNVSDGSPIIEFEGKEKGKWVNYIFPIRTLIDSVLEYREKEAKQ